MPEHDEVVEKIRAFPNGGVSALSDSLRRNFRGFLDHLL